MIVYYIELFQGNIERIPGSVHYWLHIIIAKMMSVSQLSLPHTMRSVQLGTIEVIGYCAPFAD